MRSSARWLVVFVAACGLRDPDRPTRPETVFESSPRSFFGIAGLTETTESRTFDNGWGTTRSWMRLVHRGGHVVCKVPEGSSATGEYGASHDDAQLSLTSQQPVRFVVRHYYEGHRTIGNNHSCVGYELLADGECRQAFDRDCSYEECIPHVAKRTTCGGGTLKGHLTQAREPAIGAVVTVGQQSAFTDEHGAFVLEAGAGAHTLAIDGGVSGLLHASVTIRPGEDVDVAIDIVCSQVADVSCCHF